MILPSLSPLERSRIAAAAKLHVDGVKVTWRNVGRRLAYVVDNREHLVLTAATDRVWAELTRQVREAFDAETQRLVEAREAATEAPARPAETRPDWHPAARVAQSRVPAVSTP